MKLLGLVLAGGRSQRMGGGDKGVRLLGERPILDRVIERLKPQVEAVVLNANGDPSRFARFSLPVVADGIEGFAGPLAGVLAGLDWAAENRPDCAAVLSVASDAPFFPLDLAVRLEEALARDHADVACAASGGRAQPVFAVWPLYLRADLRQAVAREGIRKVDIFTARHTRALVPFAIREADPFFNVNRPEDLVAAEELLARFSL